RLASLARCGAAPIRALIDKGLASRKKGRMESRLADEAPACEEPIPRAVPPTLTSDQLNAWAQLEPALRQPGFKPFLVHGVTGSGKTELYLRAIEEIIRQGKEALVLVPEISLTPQTIAAFQGRCSSVAVLHSHLGNAERGIQWRRVANGQAQAVVGARSAVFAPTRKLGLIVIDEEHEQTF